MTNTGTQIFIDKDPLIDEILDIVNAQNMNAAHADIPRKSGSLSKSAVPWWSAECRFV